jgi:hypothetical protein
MSTEKQSIVLGAKRDGHFPSEEHTSVGRSRHVCRRWMKCLGWMCELAMDLLRSFHHVILGSKLNVLLLCVPLAIVGVPLQFGQVIFLPIQLHLISNSKCSLFFIV